MIYIGDLISKVIKVLDITRPVKLHMATSTGENRYIANIAAEYTRAVQGFHVKFVQNLDDADIGVVYKDRKWTTTKTRGLDIDIGTVVALEETFVKLDTLFPEGNKSVLICIGKSMGPAITDIPSILVDELLSIIPDMDIGITSSKITSGPGLVKAVGNSVVLELTDNFVFVRKARTVDLVPGTKIDMNKIMNERNPFGTDIGGTSMDFLG